MIRKFIFFSLLLLIPVFAAPAQTSKMVLKENTPNVESVPKIAREISTEDWGRLESAILRENWETAALLSEQFLRDLELETKDNQISRLRYIYIYSLAGKLIAHSLLGEKSDEEKTRLLLEKASKDFIGKQFVFPVRKILANCKGVVNYVCESKENPGFVRIAATNSSGSAIHLFEYVDMNSLVDVVKHNKKEIVLQFENGFVKNIFNSKQ
jgi:hypothetical protein